MITFFHAEPVRSALVKSDIPIAPDHNDQHTLYLIQLCDYVRTVKLSSLVAFEPHLKTHLVT